MSRMCFPNFSTLKGQGEHLYFCCFFVKVNYILESKYASSTKVSVIKLIITPSKKKKKSLLSHLTVTTQQHSTIVKKKIPMSLTTAAGIFIYRKTHGAHIGTSNNYEYLSTYETNIL